MAEEKKELISSEDIMKLLDSCYASCINGIPHVSPDVQKLSQDYLSKYKNPLKAAKAMIKSQIIKCTTSGFLTGFGGVITLPITIPTNVASVLYVQMRMIATVASLAGLAPNDDLTQTFVYACLAGVSVNEIVKQTGIKVGIKFAKAGVEKIPGKVLTKINQKVGFRFLTKFGEKGVINIGKMIPVAGAVVGGTMDFIETKVIADRSIRWFFEGNYEVENTKVASVDYTDVSADNIDTIIVPEDTVENSKSLPIAEDNSALIAAPADADKKAKIGSLLAAGKEKAIAGFTGLKNNADIKKVIGNGKEKISAGVDKIKSTISDKTHSERKSDEILATLERLGMLKESGVITDEEFERKKSELLARL